MTSAIEYLTMKEMLIELGLVEDNSDMTSAIEYLTMNEKLIELRLVSKLERMIAKSEKIIDRVMNKNLNLT